MVGHVVGDVVKAILDDFTLVFIRKLDDQALVLIGGGRDHRVVVVNKEVVDVNRVGESLSVALLQCALASKLDLVIVVALGGRRELWVTPQHVRGEEGLG